MIALLLFLTGFFASWTALLALLAVLPDWPPLHAGGLPPAERRAWLVAIGAGLAAGLALSVFAGLALVRAAS